MRENTKYNLKNIFGSTVSNQCAIDAAKTLPWWSAIIVLLLGVLLPIIPLVVSVANTHGSNYVSSVNYGIDRDLAVTSLDLYDEKKTFVVDDDKILHYYDNGVEVKPNAEQDLTPIYRYFNTKEKQYELDVYFTQREFGDSTASINDLLKETEKHQYVLGTTIEKAEGQETSTCYTPSVLILHSKGLILRLYKHNSVNSSGSSYSGDWVCTKSGEDIITRMLTVEGKEIPADIKSLDYVKDVFTNYKGLLDECYITTINRMYILNTTVYFGIYVGVVVLLGLLIFILTRSKRNSNNYLKWYQCQFIMYWSSFAPGLLAMIFGFLLSTYAAMFFIVLMGLRGMWMSMRQLSPAYQTAA